MGNRGARARLLATSTLLIATATAVAPAQEGPNVLRDGFESPRPSWRQEKTDAEVRLFAHDRSNKAVREGAASERFQFDAAVGGGFYFSYPLPKVPVTPDLRVGLQVRSDRSGVQILGRVILPNDVDPETNQPSFVVVQGTILTSADRWQKLEILDMPTSIERQARVIRLTTKRKVVLDGAYLDRLVINLYGGPGPTEVFVDDLRITPVASAIARAHAGSITPREAAAPAPQPVADLAPREEGAKPDEAKSPIRIERSGLRRNGYPWFFTAIRAPGADPAKLRRAAYDVLALPIDADPDLVKEAAATGLALMPEFDAGKDGSKLDVNLVQQLMDKFPAREAIAFCSIGRSLGASNNLKARLAERDKVREVAQYLRRRKDFSGLSTADVTGLFPDYARVPDNLDLIGATPFGWGTTQDATEGFKYLEQRRFLTALENADALIYAWIPLAPSPIFKTAIWGKDAAPSWGIPRVQPDQLRLAVYGALSAGCRGLAFDADADFTKGAGRPLLIEGALINEEIDLLEWLLADTSKAMKMLPTYRPDPPVIAPGAAGLGMKTNTKPRPEEGPHPTIRAAAFGTKDRRGTVLLIADYAGTAQFQPPQMAFRDLQIDVPSPANAEAYLICPGDVQVLNHKRVPGGIRVSIPEFGPTAIVYVTTDGGRVMEIQKAVARVRPLAVNLVIEEAQLLYSAATEVQQVLVDDGHTMPEGNELLRLAAESIKSAQDAQERQDYGLAWNEARRANRPLTILMRYQWDKALGGLLEVLNDETLECGPETLPGLAKPLPRLLSPIAFPPMVSFQTIPQAWVWKDWIKRGRLGPNLVPSGDFENLDSLRDEGWVEESYELPGIDTKLLPEKAVDGMGKTSLRLAAAPLNRKEIDAATPIYDHPLVGVRTPPIPVKEANIVRISVMIHMPTMSTPGAGGIIVRDSIGGELLEFRYAGSIPGWQELVLYRRTPADGEMTVFLGYAGLQYAEFDNLRVQKITGLDAIPRPVANSRPRQLTR